MTASASSPAKATLFWALAALNAALLLMLVLRAAAPQPALAQQAAARPGDYLMVPGEVVGGSDAVVYILSQSSRQLSAMVYDDSTHTIKSMPPINLDRVLSAPSNASGTGGTRNPTLQE
jgi:hypothetical protein